MNKKSIKSLHSFLALATGEIKTHSLFGNFHDSQL